MSTTVALLCSEDDHGTNLPIDLFPQRLDLTALRRLDARLFSQEQSRPSTDAETAALHEAGYGTLPEAEREAWERLVDAVNMAT